MPKPKIITIAHTKGGVGVALVVVVGFFACLSLTLNLSIF